MNHKKWCFNIFDSVSAVKRAFERAAQQTSDIEEMVKMVKKEVGEEIYQEVGEEVEKRFICGGWCLAAMAAISLGAIAGGSSG